MSRPFAHNVSPLLLRLALGLTFLWAGLGKVNVQQTYDNPEDLARLASLGIIRADMPVPIEEAAGEDGPAIIDAAFSQEAPVATRRGGQPAEEAGDEAGEPTLAEQLEAVPAETTFTFNPNTVPDPAVLRRVHSSVTLPLHRAAFPSPAVANPEPTWPAQLSSGSTIKLMSQVGMWGEIAIGIMLIVGFWSRIAGLGAAATMFTAYFLTQFTPAFHADATSLFILPRYDLYSFQWVPVLWQLSIFASGLALLFMGSGRLSIDGVIFGSKSKPQYRAGRPLDDDDDD